MKEDVFKSLLEKYELGNCTEKEKEVVEVFLNEMQKDGITPSSVKYDLELRNRIFREIEKRTKKPAKQKNLKVWTVAASIALMVSLGFTYYFINSSPLETKEIIALIKKETSFGQKLNITLPDGTKIKLNSGSKIEFPERFSDSIRQVSLKGEAFFDVAHNPDKPFIIHTGELSTTVLGTSFNINAYSENENVSVSVATGKVRINSKTDQVLLTPNQQGVFNKSSDNIIKHEIDISYFSDWKDGILRFQDASLLEATEKLSRWFNVVFEFENEDIKQCEFTSKFNNESLHTILEGLVFIKEGLSYEVKEKNIIILKGKCNN